MWGSGTAPDWSEYTPVQVVVDGVQQTVTGRRNRDGTVTISLPVVYKNETVTVPMRKQDDTWRSSKANQPGAGWRATHNRRPK